MQSGKEFRHYRERFKRKRERLMEKGDLRGLKKLRDEHGRYTDYTTHVAARRIVDHAEQFSPCVIKLEKLTHYREGGENRIHDWPFAEIQEKIAYKALESGIPIQFIAPAYTSRECNRCGHTEESNRAGAAFRCKECGYTVHADVNAAINIARREAL